MKQSVFTKSNQYTEGRHGVQRYAGGRRGTRQCARGRRATAGFTLAELLIVVAIIAVLVSIAIPVFAGQLEKSREAVDLANVRSAYAQVMTTAMSEDETATYDGTVIKSGDKYQIVVSPLKQTRDGWDTDVDGVAIGSIPSAAWIGSPKEGGTCTITFDASNETTTVRWSGNDLNTSAGRRQEDIDNMHAIYFALKAADEAGKLWQAKNYVQVAVFKDGTMAYFQDGRGNADADTKTIRDALEAAGLSTTETSLYSSDAKWKNGYVVHYDSDGKVYYKTITEAENEKHEIIWNWWNKKNLDDEDL